MLLSSMLHVVAVTSLLALAAWSSERAVRGLAVPTRWIWAGAVVGSLGVPLLTLAWRSVISTPPEVPFPDDALSLFPFPLTDWSSTLTLPAGFDPYLLQGWAILSLAGALALLRAHVGLSSERSSWKRMQLGDREVLLADDVGPGVIGLIRPVIVMPRWALDMDPPDRELMLRHEVEHRAAGDVQITTACLWLLAALPWNAPLWWVVRRLRLAMEIDCDRRVLRGSREVRRYAALLVDIATRRTPVRAGALAFARPTPFLERRIRTMTDAPDPRAVRALGMAFLAALLVVTACQLDRLPTTPPQASIAAQDGPYFTPMTVRPTIANRREVIQAMIGAYPETLRDAGVGGRALVWFHIDETGKTVDTRLSKSSGSASMDAAALAVSRTYEFTPAYNGDAPTDVWVQIPITFEVR